MTPQAAIDTFYNPHIIIGTGQAFAIGAAIAASGARPNVLIFGCGNDSPMWRAMNEGGRTLFVEDNPSWLSRTRDRFPDLEIASISYGETTVESSFPIREDALARVPIPDVLTSSAWDVILVDGPMGFKPGDTGRSLSIYWTSRIMNENTQVFVDDYERALEKAYADRFVRSRRLWNVEMQRVFSTGRGQKAWMLWSLGVSGGPVKAIPASSSGSAPADRTVR